MPSTSRSNKGLVAGKHSKHTKESHKILWNKVKNGPPKQKYNPDFWKSLTLNKEPTNV